MSDVDDKHRGIGAGDFHVVQVSYRGGDHRTPLLDGEKWCRLLPVADRRYHDAFEHTAGSLDDLQVPVVERVEGPGEQGCLHASSMKRAKVTTVPP